MLYIYANRGFQDFKFLYYCVRCVVRRFPYYRTLIKDFSFLEIKVFFPLCIYHNNIIICFVSFGNFNTKNFNF